MTSLPSIDKPWYASGPSASGLPCSFLNVLRWSEGDNPRPPIENKKLPPGWMDWRGEALIGARYGFSALFFEGWQLISRTQIVHFLGFAPEKGGPQAWALAWPGLPQDTSWQGALILANRNGKVQAETSLTLSNGGITDAAQLWTIEQDGEILKLSSLLDGKPLLVCGILGFSFDVGGPKLRFDPGMVQQCLAARCLASCVDLDFSWCAGVKTPFTTTASESLAVDFASPTGKPPRDLSGFDFSRANLTYFDFRGTNLTGASFNESELGAVDFDNSNLTGTKFTKATLTDAVHVGVPPSFVKSTKDPTDFTLAKLPFGIFKLQWSCLNLTQATIVDLPVDLSSLVAHGAVLSGLDLSKRVLQKASFREAVLAKSGAVPATLLTGADLTHADFSGADLCHLDLAGSKKTSHVVFDSATLRAVNLAGADLSFASFQGARLDGTDDTKAATLSDANLIDTDFSNAQLSAVDFSGAYLYGDKASVAGATMRLANFTNAYLTGLDLSATQQGQMEATQFDGACLANSNFKGVDVGSHKGKVCSFVGACLQGADFSDASLVGANLTDAAVATEKGELDVTLQIDGKPQTLPIPFKPTKLPASVTDGTTICPNDDTGPCVGSKLNSPRAPTKWPPEG